MTQHKWHKEIKAWADGAEIEFRTKLYDVWGNWVDDDYPDWNDEDFEFRIKPQPKEPQYLYVYRNSDGRLGLGDTLNNANCIGKIKLEE